MGHGKMDRIRDCVSSRLSFVFVILLFSANSMETLRSEAAKLPDDEVAALKIIGTKLGKTEWDFSVDPCSGSGGFITTGDSSKNNVTCDCTYGNGTVCHIVSINLKEQNLEGVLPEEMSMLTHLRKMDLTPNYLSGTIPASWASLPLEIVIISVNRISGQIPKEFGNITTLERLRISDLNGISWRFPPLDTMKNLKKLILRNCKLLGEIPSYIWSLKSLTELDLSFNSLTGRIPKSLPINETLKVMFLRNNQLTGEVPDWIYSSTNDWDLSGNSFIGSVASTSCPQGTVDLVSSFVSTNNSIPACYRKNYPCPGVANYTSLFINCGGAAIGNKYEEDSTQLGRC